MYDVSVLLITIIPPANPGHADGAGLHMTVMLSAGQGSDGRVQLTCIVVSVGVRVKSLGALGTVK